MTDQHSNVPNEHSQMAGPTRNIPLNCPKKRFHEANVNKVPETKTCYAKGPKRIIPNNANARTIRNVSPQDASQTAVAQRNTQKTRSETHNPTDSYTTAKTECRKIPKVKASRPSPERKWGPCSYDLS